MKKMWPYAVIFLAFIVMSCVYMFPELLGEKIGAVDNVNAISAMGESIRYTQETGKQSWWNGAMYSGMPNYQIGGADYLSTKWLAPLMNVFRAGYSSPMILMLLYLVCFYVLMLSMKIGKWLSAVGAVAMALSSYFIIIIGVSHVTKATTIALMTLALAGFYLIFHNYRKTGICLCMIGTAVGFAPHPQMTYYIFFIFAAFGLAELWTAYKSKAWKAFCINCLLAIASLGIGIGTSVANTFANLEYVKETIRGGASELAENDANTNVSTGLDYKYATEYSYGIDETFTLLIPDYKGRCSEEGLYWGEQPLTDGPVYLGAVVLFLFVLSLLIVKGPYKWTLTAVAGISIVLSWGYHFETLNRLMFDWFPWFNKFRAVSSILIIAEIAVPLLAMMGLRDMIEGMNNGSLSKEKARKKIVTAAAVTAGLCIIAYISAWMFASFRTSGEIAATSDGQIYPVLDELVSQRKQMLGADTRRSLLMIAAGMAIMLTFVYGKIKKYWMVGLLGAIILIDLWVVDKRVVNDNDFQPQSDYSAAFEMQPWEKLILDCDRSESYRVVNIADPKSGGARTSYRLKNVAGYHAARLRRYDDVLKGHLVKMHMPVYSMLNTKYMIVTNQETGEPMVNRNDSAMGNAWYVKNIVKAETPRQEFDGLMKVDLKSTAIVGKDFVSSVKSMTNEVDPNAEVTLTKYEPDCLTYKAKSSVPGTIVFSEIYYPYGWKAYVDDQPVEHYRVNYILRAINIDAGRHNIRFEFRPESVEKGNTISMIFVVLMYLILGGCIVAGGRSLVLHKKTN